MQQSVAKYRLAAMQQRAKGNIKKATKYLTEAYLLDSTNLQVLSDLAYLLNDTQKYTMNQRVAASAIANYPEEYLFYYYMGEALYGKKQYAKAEPFYTTIIDESMDDALVDEAIKRNSQIEFKLQQKLKMTSTDGYEYKPERMSFAINTLDDQYCPIISIDGKQIVYTIQTRYKGRRQEDIYESHLKHGEWTDGASISSIINTKGNEGAHAISPDGKLMILTICGGQNSVGNCDLYSSELKNDKWTKPENLGKTVNSPFWDAHPTISNDSRTIYFSSERPGGEGLADIYKSIYKNGKWSKPENQTKINTSQRELTPFIHPDNTTLYFTSDGHPGMGGLDIFKTSKNEQGMWEKPLNFGSIINSAEEEFSISVSADGSTAYMAKQYSGEDSDEFEDNGFEEPESNLDLVYFELPPELKANSVFYFRGHIYDEYEDLITASQIQIFNIDTEEEIVNEKNETGDFFYSFPTKYKYAIQVTSKGYLMESYRFEFHKHGSSTAIDKDIILSKIKAETKFELKNISFTYGKAELDSTSFFELNNLVTFLKENEGISIEISGHTDSIGSYRYNQRLSENRAKSVYEYLTAHQVDSTHLTFIGYADLFPIYSNTTETGRSLNRRTEIKISGQTIEEKPEKFGKRTLEQSTLDSLRTARKELVLEILVDPEIVEEHTEATEENAEAQEEQQEQSEKAAESEA